MTTTAARVAQWRERVAGTEPPYHGTAHIYNAYRCRCTECKAGNARKARRHYRLSRPLSKLDTNP